MSWEVGDLAKCTWNGENGKWFGKLVVITKVNHMCVTFYNDKDPDYDCEFVTFQGDTSLNVLSTYWLSDDLGEW